MAICFGIIAGMNVERWRITTNREPVERGDFSDEIALLFFDKIENGILYGRLEGEEARIVVAGKEEVDSVFEGEFSFEVTPILPNLKKVPAPEWAQFVASSRGSKFYPLDSPRAALVSVKNRTFFRSAEEAMQNGFERWE